MASYNQVVLMGNLTRDVELRYTPAGTPVAKMSLAMNRKYRDKTDQLKDEVTFVDVSTFGKTAEIAHKWLAKGAPVLIGGRLRYDKWQSAKGESRSKLEVIAEDLRLLPRSGGGAGSGAGGYAGGARADAAPAPMGADESADPFPADLASLGDFAYPVQELGEPTEFTGEPTGDFDPTPEDEPTAHAPQLTMIANEKPRGRGRRRSGGDA